MPRFNSSTLLPCLANREGSLVPKCEERTQLLRLVTLPIGALSIGQSWLKSTAGKSKHGYK